MQTVPLVITSAQALVRVQHVCCAPKGASALVAHNKQQPAAAGPGLTTITTGAMTAASCITQPGTAFVRGPGTAAPCSMGTYNDGLNKRNCTRCPVGMSTASTGASSFGSCLALPGWFYQVSTATTDAVCRIRSRSCRMVCDTQQWTMPQRLWQLALVTVTIVTMT